MSGRLLFTVQDVFEIEGRGVVLSPGYLTHVDQLAYGDSVGLRRPDGTVLVAQVKSIEMVTYPADYPSEQRRSPFLIGPGFTQDDVPEGTQVWSLPGA